MPHTNNWESEGLYRKFTGELNGDEILESNFELHTHPDFSRIHYIINDFTEITGHSIEPAHTTVYAKTDDIVSITKGRLKIALVVAKAEYLDLANNYRELMKDKLFECEIFSAIEQARTWVKS